MGVTRSYIACLFAHDFDNFLDGLGWLWAWYLDINFSFSNLLTSFYPKQLFVLVLSVDYLVFYN